VPTAASCGSAAILLGLVAIGLAGPRDPLFNLMPLAIWTIWWMAFLAIQGTLADVWRLLEPWSGPARLIGLRPRLRLPARLGAWPAVAGFVLFKGFVLADPAPSDPGRLAVVVLSYWTATLAAVLLFGPRWLRRGEVFTVLFELIGRLRPRRGAGLGLPGWAMLARAPDPARAALCLAVLAAGSFDGLSETFRWLALLGVNPLEFPGRSAVVVPNLLGLVASLLLVASAFAGAVALGCRLAGRLGARVAFVPALLGFAATLLPIGLGYHVAHYLVALLVQHQYALAALADPFARGWSLPPFDAVRIRTGFLADPDPVRIIYLTQAGVVVLSHVAAAAMAHAVAAGLAGGRRGALALQAGLVPLMVGYTVFGLWLLAAPRGA
jgi:hypothetical protein